MKKPAESRGARFLPAGDAAMVVEFGRVIDPDINARVRALDARLQEAKPVGIVEVVPTYRSLLIHFDPGFIAWTDLAGLVEGLLRDAGTAGDSGRRWLMPVAYGGPHGIDLDHVAEQKGLTTDEVIRLHQAGDYQVYMIGFAPGFAYLGGLDERLHLSRRTHPRAKTPAGTVSIGGIQAAIASMEMPSGWHLLGRTPVHTFDLRRPDPFLLGVGDRVRFVRIAAAEFESMARAADRGELRPDCEAVA